MTALVTRLVQTCHACPVQFEGTLADGRAFYFRYRHGMAGLGIGATQAEANRMDGRTWMILSENVLEGWMTADEFARAFLRLMMKRAADDPSLFPLMRAAGLFTYAELVTQAQEAEDVLDRAQAAASHWDT